MVFLNEPKFDKALEWLLDPVDPGVRYLALRDIVGLPAEDSEMGMAREAAHSSGPIASILSAMEPEGFWMKAGHGYLPKYRSTVWSVIMLAQLGASVSEDRRIAAACSYLLDNSLNEGGQFSATGPPSGTVDCLQGNLCWSIVVLGYEDNRLEQAFDWMARTVTGDGIVPMEQKSAPVRYYAGKYGPDFACGANNKLSCAWGAVKVMIALGVLQSERRTDLINDAIDRGAAFLFSVDPATADYPTGYADKPSRNWWKFGFPVFYITDLLQIVEALVQLGYGRDPRLSNAINLVVEKGGSDGRWALDFSYKDKTWLDFGELKKPNKWVTLRALRVLKALNDEPD